MHTSWIQKESIWVEAVDYTFCQTTGISLPWTISLMNISLFFLYTVNLPSEEIIAVWRIFSKGVIKFCRTYTFFKCFSHKNCITCPLLLWLRCTRVCESNSMLQQGIILQIGLHYPAQATLYTTAVLSPSRAWFMRYTFTKLHLMNCITTDWV